MATQDDHHDFQEIFREIEDAKKYILIIDDGDHTHAYMRGCNLDYAHMLSGLFDEHPHIYELMHAIKEAHTLRNKMAEEMGEDEADRASAVMVRAMFGDALEDGDEAPNPATHSMEDMLRELGVDNK